MRKILFIFTLIVMTSVFASAQGETKISESWKPFTPKGEEFSVEVPESFVLTRFSQNPEDPARLYKTLFNKTYFFIASDKSSDLSQNKMIYSFAEKNNVSGKSATFGNFQASEYSFADAEGFYQKILVIQGKMRNYIFHTVSETKDNPDVERFFSSIRLDKTLPEENKTAQKKTEIAPQTDSTQKPEIRNTGLGGGIGNGSGNGNGGSNNAAANQLKLPTQTDQTSALIILSKPRAAYTDLARFYEISGSVPIRVTFLASGEIGSATPVSKLPFGLTTNAIDAARNIKFEPAKREGTAYSVTKIVIYSFTIY